MGRRRQSARFVRNVTAIAGLLGLSLLSVACSPEAESSAAVETASLVDTELVEVVRKDIVETKKVQATVGFGTAITLPIEAEGLVTWAPPVGSALTSGDVIVEVSGRPVVLVVGESPLYRPLRLVGRFEVDEARTRLGQQTGVDVGQLQRYLVSEGFDDKGRMTADEVFGTSTQRAVKAWQTSIGHPATGVVDASQLVFMSSDVVLQTGFTVGQAFAPVDVTGTGTILHVVGSTSLRDFFPVGDMIELATEPPVVGEVVRSTRVANDNGDGVSQLIEISVAGVNPDELGQSVEVVGSATKAVDVLTVPVRALLAMSDRGWQVEVDGGAGVQRVNVELVEVFGTTAVINGLEEGDQVVIPL